MNPRIWALSTCVGTERGPPFFITFSIFVHLKSACSGGPQSSIEIQLSLANLAGFSIRKSPSRGRHAPRKWVKTGLKAPFWGYHRQNRSGDSISLFSCTTNILLNFCRRNFHFSFTKRHYVILQAISFDLLRSATDSLGCRCAAVMDLVVKCYRNHVKSFFARKNQIPPTKSS